MEDLVRRQAVLDAICKICAVEAKPSECKYKKGLFGGCEEYEAIKVIPSAESKILNTLDFAIDASNGDTNYFVGFRNGLRYAKSLIDGEENPQFESCTKQEPKTGHWIGVNPMVDTLMCSECGENIISEDFKSNYCPNCGCRMVEPQESDDCRNCKKWEDCPCGKEGYESGTSQGYSIGKCKDFEPQECEEQE